MVDVSRNDIWFVDLNPPGKGLEIHGKRPALIVSVDEMNSSAANLVIVCPLTTTKRNIPAHVKIDPPEGGIKKTSFIKCDQIRSISKDRLSNRLGSISTKPCQKSNTRSVHY